MGGSPPPGASRPSDCLLQDLLAAACVCVCGSKALSGVSGISGISAAAADTETRGAICLLMLGGSDDFEQLTNSFCQRVTNSI